VTRRGSREQGLYRAGTGRHHAAELRLGLELVGAGFEVLLEIQGNLARLVHPKHCRVGNLALRRCLHLVLGVRKPVGASRSRGWGRRKALALPSRGVEGGRLPATVVLSALGPRALLLAGRALGKGRSDILGILDGAGTSGSTTHGSNHTHDIVLDARLDARNLRSAGSHGRLARNSGGRRSSGSVSSGRGSSGSVNRSGRGSILQDLLDRINIFST